MLKKFDKGFTIIELIVCMAIIVILMSVVFYNYGTFNDNLAISSTGQEMSLAIRQAQIYALNVKESGIGSEQFSYPYGVYFNYSTSPTDYFIFVDSDNDRKYTVGNGCGGAVTECVERISTKNGVRITGVDDSGGPGGCPSLNSAVAMEVLFLRPKSDAIINFMRSNGTFACTSSADGQITMTSFKGKVLQLKVQNTGQIYVQ